MTESDECFKDKEYRFWDKPEGNSRSWLNRVWLWLFRDTSWMFAPGYFDGAEDKTPESEEETKELTRYGKELGFDEHDELLDYHTDRLDKLYRFRMQPVLLVSFLALSGVTVFVFLDFLQEFLVSTARVIDEQAWAPAAIRILLGLLLILGVYAALFLSYLIAIRLITRLTDRLFSNSYAESLSIRSILFVNAALSRSGVLQTADYRRDLLERMEKLARNTSMLSQRFSSNYQTARSWADDYFGLLAYHIRARERWVIAPQESSLEELRTEFYELACIYVSENYGEFPAPEEKEIEAYKAQKEVQETGSVRRVLGGVLRIGVGIVIPLVGLTILFLGLEPTSLERLDIPRSVLTYIFIAWFLLAVDASLNLGIVERLTDLAKGIKGLG